METPRRNREGGLTAPSLTSSTILSSLPWNTHQPPSQQYNSRHGVRHLTGEQRECLTIVSASTAFNRTRVKRRTQEDSAPLFFGIMGYWAARLPEMSRCDTLTTQNGYEIWKAPETGYLDVGLS